MQIKIQVVIPFYGSRKFLEMAIESVLNQSNPSWTLLVIDDFSGVQGLNTYINSLDDARISLISNSRNLGISKNFVKVLECADQEYLTVLGCDDILHENYVDRCLELATEYPEASFIQPGVEVIDQNGMIYTPLTDMVKGIIGKQSKYPALLKGEDLASSLAKGCWTYFPSICWKTTEIMKTGFRETFSTVLDLDLIMRMVVSGAQLLVDDQHVFFYRRHRESASMMAAVDGNRFSEEVTLYKELEIQFGAMAWSKAKNAAKWRISSRLNALLHFGICFFTLRWKYLPRLFKYSFIFR